MVDRSGTKVASRVAIATAKMAVQKTSTKLLRGADAPVDCKNIARMIRRQPEICHKGASKKLVGVVNGIPKKLSSFLTVPVVGTPFDE